MKPPFKYLRILLTLMTVPREYQYWVEDNEKLIVPNAMLPSWIAVINALEALDADYEKMFPEYLIDNQGEQDAE